MRTVNRTEALNKLVAAREKVRACADAIRQKKDHEIAYCEYRSQHESTPLEEEKQLLREIKSLEANREAVFAEKELHAELSELLVDQDDIQERLKPLISELEPLETQWTIAIETCKAAEAEFEEKETAFTQMLSQRTSAQYVRQIAYSELEKLTKQEYAQASAQRHEYYHSRREIEQVRQLASKKERKAVEDWCNAQVERVMALWNGDTEYREIYGKSNERSALKRLQTLDGRALGPDEDNSTL